MTISRPEIIFSEKNRSTWHTVKALISPAVKSFPMCPELALSVFGQGALFIETRLFSQDASVQRKEVGGPWLWTPFLSPAPWSTRPGARI